jgi:hypothetical protein
MVEEKTISGVLGGILAGGLISAMSLSRIKPIDAMTLRQVLRETLDLHSTFQWEHFLEQGVDAHFIARTIGLNGVESPAKASDFWKVVDYATYEGSFTLPASLSGVSVHSRRAFKYPQLYGYLKMPDLTPVGSETYMSFRIGFRQSPDNFNGAAYFELSTEVGYASNVLRAYAGTLAGGILPSLEAVKPSDFLTTYHSYRIAVAKNNVLFFINSALRAVFVQCLPEASYSVYNNAPPYAISLIPPLASSLSAFMEIYTDRSSPAPADFTAPVSPYDIAVSDGKEIIPLTLPLFKEGTDTVLAGYAVSSGSVTSHPIPTFGYSRKTLYFMADQAGTLEVQVFTYSSAFVPAYGLLWKNYDSVSVPANTLLKYSINDEVVLARVVFTPSTYPASVLVAEISMS